MRTLPSVRKTATLADSSAPSSSAPSRSAPSRSAGRRWRRGWLISLSFATALAVAGIGGSAAALPQPTITQVKARLAALNTRSARLGQQYDQVLQELAAANQRLKVLDQETARYRTTFDRMRAQIGRLAAVAYEQGGASSPVALLTSESPQQVLNQSSILDMLSVANASQIRQYREASRQLLDSQQAASRARAAIVQLKHSLGKRIAVLKKLEAKQSALLAQLTPAQQTGTGPGAGGSGGGGSGGKPPAPAGSAAGKAVAFAEAQIGCPYVYGGTGPCNSGFDCSGLMMASWGYAGVSIPRVSYAQMSSLPAVPLHNSAGNFTTAYLQPGDILGFAGNSHVGMYVGGGMLVDAPVPGQNVEKVALSGWYLSNLDGAVRP